MSLHCFPFFVYSTIVVVSMLILAELVNISRQFEVPSKDEKFGVLVTGCASGLGYDLVRAFLEEDHHPNVVVFAAVRKPEDVALLKTFRNQQRLVPLQMDVAQPAQVKEGIKVIERSGVPLYGIVNNAGIGARRVIDSDPADHYLDGYRKVFDVNIFGLAHLTGSAMSLLKDAAKKVGSARVVNIGSLMGIVYTPACSGYCASKHALEALSDDWRFQLDPHNISVSLVQPGFFKTNMCSRSLCKDDPSVCSDVVLKALFDKRPTPRYQCASVMGIPASVMAGIVNLVPERLIDFILRHFEKLEASGTI